MTVDFMTWAMVIAALRLLAFVLLGFLVFKTVESFARQKRWWPLWAVATSLVFGFGVFGGSVTSPKIRIDQPFYKQQSKETTIVTPPPRTEKLEGFKPLTEGNDK